MKNLTIIKKGDLFTLAIILTIDGLKNIAVPNSVMAMFDTHIEHHGNQTWWKFGAVSKVIDYPFVTSFLFTPIYGEGVINYNDRQYSKVVTLETYKEKIFDIVKIYTYHTTYAKCLGTHLNSELVLFKDIHPELMGIIPYHSSYQRGFRFVVPEGEDPKNYEWIETYFKEVAANFENAQTECLLQEFGYAKGQEISPNLIVDDIYKKKDGTVIFKFTLFGFDDTTSEEYFNLLCNYPLELPVGFTPSAVNIGYMGSYVRGKFMGELVSITLDDDGWSFEELEKVKTNDKF